MPNKNQIVILYADDDEDDQMLTQEAFEESNLGVALHFASDGLQLLDYLYNRPPFEDSAQNPRPDLILLDLNMPRMDGREVLAIMKKDVKLRSIPVIVFTTSRAEFDILRSYDLGVNCFITKPVNFTKLVEVVQQIGQFWFELVELPAKHAT